MHKGFKQGRVTKHRVFDFLSFSLTCNGFNCFKLKFTHLDEVLEWEAHHVGMLWEYLFKL